MSKPEAKERLAKVQASLRDLRIDLHHQRITQEQDAILFNAIMQLGPLELIASSLRGIDDSTRLALREAVEHFTESAEEWDALAEGTLDESARDQAIRGAAEDRHTAAVLKRLTGEGERSMGMFDYVNYECVCPVCHSKVDGFQSKDGECQLEKVAPESVDNFYAPCGKCGCWIELNRKAGTNTFQLTAGGKWDSKTQSHPVIQEKAVKIGPSPTDAAATD